MRAFPCLALLLVAVFCLPACLTAGEKAKPGRGIPAFEERDTTSEQALARAVLQIKSEAGICLWTISGDDDLVRLPVEDERFASILLSARFAGDELQLTLGGEKAPLEVTPLGQLDLSLRDGEPVTVDSFRAVKAGKGGWELQVVPSTKVDTLNCCTCGLYKLTCCPRQGYCIGCGACGTCCG